MIEKISYVEWYNIKNKTDDVDVELNHNDIVYKINDLYCACETKNECNNILIYSDKYNIENIKSMILFIYILGKYENIEYITVVSKKGRYRLYQKIFHAYGAFNLNIDDDTKERMVFKLDENALNDLYNFVSDYKA
jgi:hypothetical protein